MLSDFPSELPLHPSLRAHAESHTELYRPYSDFNFTSLCTYNTKGEVHLSVLNGNLVVRFSDYVTGAPFYSFLGTSSVNETARTLLEHMEASGYGAFLKLVPDETAQQLDPTLFSLEEDPDNFDYILPVARLCTYLGSDLKPHRNAVTRFLKSFHPETRILDLTSTAVQAELAALFRLRTEQKYIPFSEAENEYTAMHNLFTLPEQHRFVGMGIYVDGVLAAFTISEILDSTYATIHFEKADPVRFVGVYQYIMQETAKYLAAHGCQFINYQQDLGLPGLKKSKERLAPDHFLKKWRVQWKHACTRDIV